MHGQTDRQTKRWTDIEMNRWRYGHTDGWMDRIDSQKERPTYRWNDNGQTG